VFCFLLPFTTMSCPAGQFTFSGLEMVTGTTVADQKLSGEPLAALALLCAVVGLLLCFVKRTDSAADLVAALLGAAGGVLLLLLQAKVENDALKEGNGLVHISFRFGFWLAILALAAGAFLSFMRWQERRVSAKAGLALQPPSA
jgi:hypothetical protein